MNKIIKNALILAAITLIAGLLLGAAHQVTLEPIQKQQEKEKQESCKEQKEFMGRLHPRQIRR